VINFLLYAGCARAGSTWLYGELSGRGDCDLSNIKEHFLFMDGFTLNPDFDKSSFFDHYRKLAENPEVKLLGEMSPSNGFATIEQLDEFAAKATLYGFKVLPVIILRDPINQKISETKLDVIAKLSVDSNEKISDTFRRYRQNTSSDVPVTLDDVLNIPVPFEYRLLNWEKTIENYRQVFGNIFIGFYETLFTENSMMELCEYLQIPYTDFNFSKIANKLLDINDFTDEEKQIIYNNIPHCKQNYDYAVENFGKDFIESIWWRPNK